MGLFGKSENKQAEKLKFALGKFRQGIKNIVPGLGGDFSIERLEAALLSSDVGLETVEKLIQPLESGQDKGDPGEHLRKQIIEIFHRAGPVTLQISDSSPTVYFFVGVNGSGKTTSMAKLAHNFDKQIIFAAADTFRAAAIEQLKKWGERLDLPVISHQKGGDPTAVVYDALEAAVHRQADFLFVDTAGRLHTRRDLMEQLEKMYRVTVGQKSNEPTESLLVLDASTGQNGLQQVRTFAEKLPVTGIILSKLDSTARGGVALSVVDELGIPVKLVGTGETLDDLAPFSPEIYCDALLGEEF